FHPQDFPGHWRTNLTGGLGCRSFFGVTPFSDSIETIRSAVDPDHGLIFILMIDKELIVPAIHREPSATFVPAENGKRNLAVSGRQAKSSIAFVYTRLDVLAANSPMEF